MSPRGFLVLAVATLVATGLAGWSIATRDLPVTGTQADLPLAAGLIERANDVAVIRVQGEGGAATLRRVDGRFVLEERGGFPADPAKVQQLLLALGSARLIEAKTDQEARLKRLELEDPKLEGAKSKGVTIEDASGATLVSVVVGKERYGLYGPGRAGSYVRRGGETQAWLADRRVDVPDQPLDWLARDILDLPASELRAITLKPAAAEPVTLTRGEGEGARLELAAVPEGREPDPDKIDRLADTLGRLTFQDVARAEAPGLPEGTPRALFETRDGLRIEVAVERRGEGDKAEWWARFLPFGTDAAAGRAAEIAKRLEGWSFRLSSYLAERLTWTAESLLKEPGKSS